MRIYQMAIIKLLILGRMFQSKLVKVKEKRNVKASKIKDARMWLEIENNGWKFKNNKFHKHRIWIRSNYGCCCSSSSFICWLVCCSTSTVNGLLIIPLFGGTKSSDGVGQRLADFLISRCKAGSDSEVCNKMQRS